MALRFVGEVEIAGISIQRYAGGKMVESWLEMDVMSMMQQLGVLPAQR